jgi:uncharacterized Zn-finger protein
MKVPSELDTVVRVGAFVTDQGFGYDHWQARQFMAPKDARPSLLVICETEADRLEAQERIHHVFNDYGPKENGFKFCPYCGKPLKETP